MADANLLDLTEVEDSKGRILTGAGVSEESLEEVIDAHEERHAPPDAVREPVVSDPAGKPDPAAASTPARDESTGQFTKEPKGQKRYALLYKEREDARREIEDWKGKYAKLEADLKARPTPSPSPAAQPAPAAAILPTTAPPGSEGAAAPARPMPDEVGTKYQTWKDYEDALWQWRADAQQRDIAALIQNVLGEREATSAFKGHVNEVWAKGRAKYPDFEQKLSDPAFDAIVFPGPTLQAIAEAPASEDIQYRLASDHAAAKALAAETNPYRVGMILAALSGGPPAASPASGPAPVLSTPPAPYQPVGGRAKSATPSLEERAESGDDYDSSGYREARRREREGR